MNRRDFLVLAPAALTTSYLLRWGLPKTRVPEFPAEIIEGLRQALAKHGFTLASIQRWKPPPFEA